MKKIFTLLMATLVTLSLMAITPAELGKHDPTGHATELANKELKPRKGGVCVPIPYSLLLQARPEIDAMVSIKGFLDNGDGRGVNYIGKRLLLEDMHPANVFVDVQSDQPICIDCIVKFKR